MTRLRWSENRGLRATQRRRGGRGFCRCFCVPPEVAGQRVDAFLKAQLKRTSRTRAQFIVRASAYDDKGKRLRPGSRVSAHQIVLLWRPPWDEVAVPTEVPILYEDEKHLLAVEQAPARPPRAPERAATTLQHAHQGAPAQAPQAVSRSGTALGPGDERRCSSSREDRRVRPRAQARLRGTGRASRRVCAAITWGVPVEPGERLRVDRALELDPEDAKTKVKMRVRAHPGARPPRAPSSPRRRSAGRYALVRCELLTGRQHQIPSRPPRLARHAHRRRQALRHRRVALHARRRRRPHGRRPRPLLELPRHAPPRPRAPPLASHHPRGPSRSFRAAASGHARFLGFPRRKKNEQGETFFHIPRGILERSTWSSAARIRGRCGWPW